jgi:hypothetical protein
MNLPKLIKMGNSLNRVEMDCGTLWFSYETLVAFQTPKSGLFIRENEWGPTTGRHMKMIEIENFVDPAAQPRVDGKVFFALFGTYLG